MKEIIIRDELSNHIMEHDIDKSHDKKVVRAKDGKAHRIENTIDSANAIHRVENRVTIKTEGGTITRSNQPLSGINPDNNPFFQERSNILSSKGD